jgi:hypothetical protein
MLRLLIIALCLASDPTTRTVTLSATVVGMTGHLHYDTDGDSQSDKVRTGCSVTFDEYDTITAVCPSLEI